MAKSSHDKHIVYVLKSGDYWRFYVGMTTHIERRLSEHNSGKTRSTKGYRPRHLFFTETYETRAAAKSREKYLKSGYGKQWIKDKWKRKHA